MIQAIYYAFLPFSSFAQLQSKCLLFFIHTGCHAHWLPIFTVEGCFGARKQDIMLDQAKTSQLDKQ
jgi:hypothetical protein